MFRYMKFGPYICIAVVLAILFVLWAFWGGRNYEFVGLSPLSPDTCGSYTGSVYNWGNITPATAYNPIEGQSCVPSDVACTREDDPEVNKSENIIPPPRDSIIIDNTPIIPQEFTTIRPHNDLEIKNDDDTTIFHHDAASVHDLPLILDAKPAPPPPNKSSNIPRNPQFNQTSRFGKRPGHPSSQRGRFISRGERLCCQTLYRIYGVTFKSTWPDWLVNPETGETLELDCYNEELKIAVEYNGEQHYKWPNFTNQTYQQFLNQVRRDSLKFNLCDRNGVYLIVVPYNVPYDNIPSYIMSHLPETIQKRLQEEKILSDIAA